MHSIITPPTPDHPGEAASQPQPWIRATLDGNSLEFNRRENTNRYIAASFFFINCPAILTGHIRLSLSLTLKFNSFTKY